MTTYRSYQAAGGLGTSLTVDRPPSTFPGDMMVALVAVGATSSGTYETPQTPSGWTALKEDDNTPAPWGARTFYKVAGATEPPSYTWTLGAGFANTFAAGVIVSYGDVAAVDVDSLGTFNVNSLICRAPSVTTTSDGARVVLLYAVAGEAAPFSTPAGTTKRGETDATFSVAAFDFVKPVAGATGDIDSTNSDADNTAGAQIVLTSSNSPPDAPSLTFPVSQTVNTAQTTRFSWDFSDPNTFDSQSQFQLQVRAQGSGTTDVDVTSEMVNTFYDLAGSTLAADDYEWRVRTWDQSGEVGPWSSWEPFTAAAAPSGPSITDPVNGQTIGTGTYTVVWSAADQDAYQVRKVADDGGSPDTSDVLFDTGTVSSSGARSATLDFDTNNRTEHVQVRVQRDGLWSAWTSVSVDVSYTSPETPTLTVNDTAVAGAVQVQASHPTPGVGVPAVQTVDVERRLFEAAETVRVAAGLVPDAVFTDWTVASGVVYQYRVRAYAANGTTTYSAWSG